jgi:hypothetical protein
MNEMQIHCKNCGEPTSNLVTEMCLKCAVETFPIGGLELTKCWRHVGNTHTGRHISLPAKLIRKDGTWQLLFADGVMTDTRFVAWGEGMFYKRTMEKIVRGQPFT